MSASLGILTKQGLCDIMIFVITRILISMIIWVVGTSLTIILFLAMLFFSIVLYPFDPQRRVAHAQCYWWSDILTRFNPYWDLSVSGLENIDKKRTYIIVANHQSLADIVLMYRIRTQFKWVAKESLFSVPFIGWNMRLAKHVMLERGDFGSIKKVYREAATWLRAGMSVLFFPEGTRSETNEMGDFQNGAFKLAIKEKVPVLPILLEGTGDAIPKGSWIFGRKTKGGLKVLPPIETSGFSPADFEKLKDLARSRLCEAAKTS